MQACRNITRKSGSNLALAFVLLPKDKQEGMSALYAFCREVDDVADEETVPVAERRAALAEWRADIRRACQGETPQFEVNRELQPVIQRHQLPFELFDDLIRGVEADLDILRYPTFEALEQYCYRVASVVGLLSIRIFGYQDPACEKYAVALGKALQLTNILRDVRNDAQRGRIYLPTDVLRQAGVSEADILACRYSPQFLAAAKVVADRARHYYQLANETLPKTDRRSMIAAELMGAVYWCLLRKLEAPAFQVFGEQPIRVGKPQKIFLILRTWCRLAMGIMTPNYGR